jgi:multisubunit Na+/H+ antiporter MnhC subunit
MSWHSNCYICSSTNATEADMTKYESTTPSRPQAQTVPQVLAQTAVVVLMLGMSFGAYLRLVG